MENLAWYGSISALFGTLVVSCFLGYWLNRWTYKITASALSRWSIVKVLLSACPFVYLVYKIGYVLTTVMSKECAEYYRAIPTSFFWFWGILLLTINVWFGISVLSTFIDRLRPFSRWTAGCFYDFVHVGGFWGNHFHEGSEKWPDTRHNAWGWFAVALFAIVGISLCMYKTPAYFESVDVPGFIIKTVPDWFVKESKDLQLPELSRQIGLDKAVEKVKNSTDGLIEKSIEKGKKEYEKTVVGAFLDFVKPDTPASAPVGVITPAPPVTPPLPIFPRRWSWFIMFFVTGIWAFVAFLLCRRDGIPALWAAIKGMFRKKKGIAVATTASAAVATKAAAASASAGSREGSLSRIMGKEIMAEAAVEGATGALSALWKFVRRAK